MLMYLYIPNMKHSCNTENTEVCSL